MEHYLVTKKRLINQNVNPLDFLVHYHEIKTMLTLLQATHTLEPDTLAVHIKFKNERAILYPLFGSVRQKKRYYSSDLNEFVCEFAGWRPYKPREIKRLSDKVRFKEDLRQHGVLTPDYSTELNNPLTDVIVKRRASSSSQHLKGPFLRSSDYALDVTEGEFYEKFTPGALLKIWFWCERPTALLLRDMCYVVGDGNKTIAECIDMVPCKLQDRPQQKHISSVLNFANRNLSTVLDKGEKQLIDFRWTGTKGWFQKKPHTVFSESEEKQFAQEIFKLGKILWPLIVKEIDHGLAYSVDAILTEDRQLSILEANANPSIHPSMYKTMCDEILTNLLVKKTYLRKKWNGRIFNPIMSNK